ncbi:Uncharacterised protein [uncultured archaeon]|nr:Uncharacterised protein [uncultured archaeon]
MADSRDYITHYTKYFNLNAPSSRYLVTLLLLIGAVAGTAMSLIINYPVDSPDYVLVFAGLCTGIIVIGVPALLTVVFIKAIKRKMQLKHAILATIVITAIYAFMLVVGAAILFFSRSITVAYIILLVSNACVYGYWFLLGRLVIGRGKDAAAIAATQPVLNTLFYLPLGTYILVPGVPLDITLIKLFAGMLVFWVAGNAFLFAVDRPAKKILDVSGVKIATTMVGQWLFDLTNDTGVIGQGAGIKRDLDIRVLALKGRKGYKAVFVNPDIHFGPFAGVGGSVTPVVLGDIIVKKLGCAPFVLHSAQTLEDNPISAAQVQQIGRRVAESLSAGLRFKQAYGDVKIGEEAGCRAIDIGIGNASVILLTRAPEVTEDMDRDVGRRLLNIAEAKGRRVLLVDAHNSRFESARPKDLEEVHAGNPHIRSYEAAIAEAATGRSRRAVRCGSAYSRLKKLLGNPKDMGEGYTSVCVFGFGKRKYGIIYFDANNMLPGFRNRIIEHAREKFGLELEVGTTDTHSINSLSLTASNSLGRHTSAERMLPVIDSMLQKALYDMEPVKYAYAAAGVSGFAVWGSDADALIERTSTEVKRILKFVTPILIIATFIIAAWVIYIV